MSIVEVMARAIAAEDVRFALAFSGIGLPTTQDLERRMAFTMASAALSALEAAGYVVVPREPTQEMLRRCNTGANVVWQQMLAAAKETP